MAGTRTKTQVATWPVAVAHRRTSTNPPHVEYRLHMRLGPTRPAPSTATTLTPAEPAQAALLAVVVVGERMAPLGWAGLTVIGVALTLLTVRAPGRPVTPPGQPAPAAVPVAPTR